MLVKENERIDDLQFRGLKLIQNPESFCFGTDAVLLAHFATVKKNAVVCDLGTGTGILPVLLYGRHEFLHCDAVEIQPDMADMARRSMELNNLTNKISVHCADLRNIKDILPAGGYSTVVCNPPYKKKDSGEKNLKREIAICRHEVEITQSEIAFSAYKMLKHGGRLRICQRTERLPELFSDLEKAGLNPSVLQFVVAKNSQKPYLALVEAVKGVKRPFKVLPNYEN